MVELLNTEIRWAESFAIWNSGVWLNPLQLANVPIDLAVMEVWFHLEKEALRRHTSLMKTAITIPASLFSEADQLAGELGVSRSELYARALQTLLKQYRDEQVSARLNDLYAEEDSSLDPVIVELQALATQTSVESNGW
ncbi:MAG TPA: hypothetical protein VFZ34_08560 [Blastocatellia bacterium]|nr:hypothetical protein [Blastocatellia bacterium]